MLISGSIMQFQLNNVNNNITIFKFKMRTNNFITGFCIIIEENQH